MILALPITNTWKCWTNDVISYDLGYVCFIFPSSEKIKLIGQENKPNLIVQI